ncbi:hypothetical protein BW730_11045 [Tessaracoccus aquimaris]|uniref:Aminoglycoside phosphotransferase domain-containing protein n=1 Tax=Tessaracoccus aquimaris TaxID=1332264 RepID=A0A1Q2CPB4_9ACTN|nr:phosphotransferase [Tessaracoccus aquimaris]AQP47946.1 hypothetical protein BW730_11045 [Tessaracoccus aquimaris]
MSTLLSDVEWGDVVSDDDGVLVIRGEVGDLPVVVKRFADTPHRREVDTYALLGELGVPTLPVLGSGPDWLILEDLVSAGYRQGTEADLSDPRVARLIAHWYDALHAAGDTVPAKAIDYSEFDLIDPDALAAVARRWPDLLPFTEWATRQLPAWRDTMGSLPSTLTYNDFAATNLAVFWDGSSALMFDYNLTGMGLRASDLRNVSALLTPEASEAFDSEYRELAQRRGVDLPGEAERLDEATSHLVALILAVESEETPAWAEPSLAWARSSTADDA